MNSYETVNLLKKYLYSDIDINPEKEEIIYNLYIFYKKLNSLKDKISEEEFYSKLFMYENKIYNINSKSLTDIEKIELELNNYRDVDDKKISLRIKKILNLIRKKIKSETLSDDDIMYFKRCLVEIQILSGNNITFYHAAYTLFEIYLSAIEKELEKKEKVKK